MVRTLVRTFIFLFFILHRVLFDPLFYFINLLFLVLKIRVILDQFSTLNLTLAMVRLVIPLVARMERVFFVLLLLT